MLMLRLWPKMLWVSVETARPAKPKMCALCGAPVGGVNNPFHKIPNLYVYNINYHDRFTPLVTNVAFKEAGAWRLLNIYLLNYSIKNGKILNAARPRQVVYYAKIKKYPHVLFST